MSRSISRRGFLSAVPAASVASLAFAQSAWAAEGSVVIPSGDVVGFTYIDVATVASGGEQNIALAIEGHEALNSAVLSLAYDSSEDSLDVPAARIEGSSALFTFSPAASGTYRLESLSFSDDGSDFLVDFSDCSSDAASFCVAEETSGDDELLTTVSSYDASGNQMDEISEYGNEPLMETYSVQTYSSRSKGLMIALNPGHGGADGGAGANGANEADMTWKIAMYCKAKLEMYQDVKVFLTRTQYETVSVKERVDRAAGAGCDVYVSLHINAGGGSGAEVWVPYNSGYHNSAHVVGERLGENIVYELAKLGIKNRGTSTRIIDDELNDHYGYDSDGDGKNDTYADYYGDIRYSRLAGMPGIIVEHAFIDSSDYWNYLNADYKLRALGEADARGIAQTYGLTTEPDDLNRIRMYRLYNPYTGEHFYTSDVDERVSLISVGWLPEGTGWNAPKSSGSPVYRLYNPCVAGGDHHYTMDENEYNQLQKIGWRGEGISWYSDDSKEKPVYREYNPNATTGTHNYTTDSNEHETLINLGWRGEDIAWYGLG